MFAGKEKMRGKDICGRERMVKRGNSADLVAVRCRENTNSEASGGGIRLLSGEVWWWVQTGEQHRGSCECRMIVRWIIGARRDGDMVNRLGHTQYLHIFVT